MLTKIANAICVAAMFVGGFASAAEPQIREGERPREPQTNVVRIMSYNVRHCRGADNKVDVNRVADRILSENPDFACLNEIKPPQALELGKKVKMFATPCGMRSCNAVLSRKPPVRIEEVALPWNCYGPRSLMVCEFPEFAVAVMHYDCGDKALQCRIDSAAVVRDTIARYGKPVFVAGDWNAEPHTEPIAALRGCVKILSAENTRTWHGFGKHKTLQPGKTEYCIDYISVDLKSADRATLIETHVVKDDVTSDHYPVVATIRLAAETREPSPAPAAQLRLATYNIHQGMGKFDKKFKYAIREQLDYLEWEKLDVFGLNEVNWHIERSGMADAPADIAALTGRYVEYAAARSVGKGNYGNAVVSKEKPISTLRVDLPRGNGQKGLKCSLMLCEFKDFWFGSTHLEVRSAITNQFKSVEILRKVVAEKSKMKPVFLSGDWNNEPDSITLAKMGEFMTILNDPKERTYNGFSEKPKDDEHCIDYIAVDNAHAHLFTVAERRVKGSSFASDHNPVFVTLEMHR